MIEELAEDYSSYLKVDLNSELHNVEETIEDMLTRLDEFENLVNMVKTDGEFCVEVSVPQVLQCKEKLDLLCDRIDRLEHFVNHVKTNMDIIEAKVDEAESDVGQTVGTFKNIFKPLFFKKSVDPAAKKTGRTPTYEAPALFATTDFFPPTDEEPQSETVDKN